MTTTPKEKAIQHLQAALDTGVRGIMRDGIKALLAQGAAINGQARADLEYRNLAEGAKMRCPAHPGLLMRNGKRTGKVWIFQYRDKTTGKEHEHQFGHYPAMSLSVARDRWADLRGKHKADRPLADEPQTTLTIDDLVEAYLSDYARKVKRSHGEDERLLRRHLVPAYGSMPANEFGHEHAAELLHGILQTNAPREAEKLRACLSTMFNFASGRTRKVFTQKPLLPPTHPNPVKAVILPSRKPKNHKPTVKELAKYTSGLAQNPFPGSDALRFQLLTMTRITEAVHLRWDEIDLEIGQWVLPAARAKNGHEHTIFLSTQALELLHKIKVGQDARKIKTEYVFPSPRSPRAPWTVNNVQHKLALNRAVLGVSAGFTSHAVRHAALTWAAEEGCPLDVRNRLTNHVSGGGVDAIYNAAALNGPAREWFQRWGNYLDVLAAPTVVPLTEPYRRTKGRC